MSQGGRREQDLDNESSLDATEAGLPLPSVAGVAPVADTTDGTGGDAEGSTLAPSVSSERADFGGGNISSSSSSSSIDSSSSISRSDVPALKGRDAGGLTWTDGPPELQSGHTRKAITAGVPYERLVYRSTAGVCRKKG